MTVSQDRRQTAYMGLLLAFALILAYVESLVPFFFGVPGMKLGLANLAVLLTLFLFGPSQAFMLNIARIVLSSFMFGNMSMLLYSAAGGVLSFCAMFLMRKTGKFSMTGVSMGGGVFHNIGQLVVAFLVVRTEGIFYYIPALLFAGVGTGFLNGMIGTAVWAHLPLGKGQR